MNIRHNHLFLLMVIRATLRLAKNCEADTRSPRQNKTACRLEQNEVQKNANFNSEIEKIHVIKTA